ncbi:MAG: hypothetical protein EVJ48_06425 [Candidatus Acidulodesulfobacterium acidiphilum]|uniref:Glycosyltransferase RgtA/B/C/D-like domain-containing protein n=1 Tax=Candidatus Acidulodesulfobacterium acidiphilum TaxID=2597224 RepID=A0A520XC70_9DELT|nr:MAG: hypothetical protein EVJ48_06425 [Candidatus Acidulodesulfobacterium acidiphilum]
MQSIKNKFNKEMILLFLIYISFSIIKAIIALLFIKTIQVIPDEFTFTEIARSIIKAHKLGYYFGHPIGKEPLYSIFISIAFLFHNMIYSYGIIKILNAFLSSIIIFPLYFLAKELLNKKSALLIAVLTGLLPASNSYSLNILAENIYFPCFLVSIYFLFKYETKKQLNFAFLSGIFIGLSFLAKPTGISLFAGYLLYVLFYSIVSNKHGILDKVKKIFSSLFERKIIFIVSALIILSWLIRNGYYFGFSVTGMLNYHYGEAKDFLNLHVSYILLFYLALEHIALMVISSGIIPFLFFLYVLWLSFKNFLSMDKNEESSFEKTKKLLGIFIFPFILLLFIASKQSELMVYTAATNRLLGRHIAVIMPLIFLIGAVGFDIFNKHKNLKSLRVITVLLSFIIVLIAIFSINKYITAQAIIGSPGDLFLYLFKSSNVPLLSKMHLILLPSFFTKILIILILLCYVFFQFKNKFSLKFYFTSLVLFLSVANIYAIAGNIGLDRWVIGSSKIPTYLVKHKIPSRKIIVANKEIKNIGFKYQLWFWIGNNFIRKNIFPKKIKLLNSQLNNNKRYKIFLPHGKYKILCKMQKIHEIFLNLNKKQYLCILNKPIEFYQHNNNMLIINVSKKYEKKIDSLIIQSVHNKYHTKKVYYISNQNYFNSIMSWGNIHLTSTNNEPYFYY